MDQTGLASWVNTPIAAPTQITTTATAATTVATATAITTAATAKTATVVYE
jgi:hypothetical protein